MCIFEIVFRVVVVGVDSLQTRIHVDGVAHCRVRHFSNNFNEITASI